MKSNFVHERFLGVVNGIEKMDLKISRTIVAYSCWILSSYGLSPGFILERQQSPSVTKSAAWPHRHVDSRGQETRAILVPSTGNGSRDRTVSVLIHHLVDIQRDKSSDLHRYMKFTVGVARLVVGMQLKYPSTTKTFFSLHIT